MWKATIPAWPSRVTLASEAPRVLGYPDPRRITRVEMVASKTPLVSVVVASYNHARYLDGTIGSVLGQTAGDLELVVVDDGSTDDSLERLRDLARRDDRLVVLTHDGGANRGRQASFRLAI